MAVFTSVRRDKKRHKNNLANNKNQNKINNIEEATEVILIGHGIGDLVQVNIINQITSDTAMTIISKEGKAAEEQRQKWREQYSNKSTESMSHLEALRTLGLTVETLSKNFEEKLKQIKQAYRTLALKFHPDRVAESQKKEQHMKSFVKSTQHMSLLTK